MNTLASVLANPKPSSFWHFAGAVAAGNAAAFGSAYLTRKLMDSSTEDRQNLTAAFVGLGAFWLVGGLTWAALVAD